MERKKFLTTEERLVLDTITFGKNWNLAGSQNDPNILWSMDYDANQYLDNLNLDRIVREFGQKVKKLTKMEGLYLGDVKTQIGDHKIRWTKEQIIKGKQGSDLTLKSQLQHKDVFFKIDVLAFLPSNGSFHEFTNTLFYKQSTPKKDMMANIKEEAEELKRDGEIYKSLKRWYSFYRLKNNPSKYKKIRVTLNQPLLGILHQMREGLESLIYLLENHRLTTSNMRFQTDLAGFKEMLWHISTGLSSQKVKQMLKMLDQPSLNTLIQMRDQIQKALANQTNKFIE
eukprot:gb/GECG01009205.1/.p1 GENE.gb/GECG01009205.1/~~gb/GECG01009205.1/.p1  ORF type:complete len:284 (+),score=40.35 gb/GECG01009205.1/:1-852(+)